MKNKEKTIVGIPFYEKEGQESLEIMLHNVDECLDNLDAEASILVQVNGPETSKGIIPEFYINPKAYNHRVEIKTSEKSGQAYAMNSMLEEARKRKIGRMFFTDADIYRLPDSMKNMWKYKDATVVGARYRPYPIDIVEAEFGELTYKQRLLYQMFDGDQLPAVRKVLQYYGVDRTDWVKSSMMLIDVNKVGDMYDNQSYATDSVMNRKINGDDIAIAKDALFLHMGRIDMSDHIKARLRHFRAARSRNNLDSFLHNEINLPDEATINMIAKEIRHNEKDGDFMAMLYLSRCAIRNKVNEICMSITKGEWQESNLKGDYLESFMDVKTYKDAELAVSRFFTGIDWDDICGYSLSPPPTTQEALRKPFCMDSYKSSIDLAHIAILRLKLNEGDDTNNLSFNNPTPLPCITE